MQQSGIVVNHPSHSNNSDQGQRGAQRYSLLIRTAKLSCEIGEFLCVIRDVSATGVRLKLFHHLPADRHLALELGNGEVYFVERVWERDGHAGFRFAGPIDVQAFIAEVSPHPRRPVRLRTGVAASVSAQGLSADAVIRDLSQRGAGIETGRQLAKGQPVTLDAPGLPQLTARVAWRNGRFYGLAFEKVFTLEELARLSVVLQMPDTRSPLRAASCA